VKYGTVFTHPQARWVSLFPKSLNLDRGGSLSSGFDKRLFVFRTLGGKPQPGGRFRPLNILGFFCTRLAFFWLKIPLMGSPWPSLILFVWFLPCTFSLNLKECAFFSFSSFPILVIRMLKRSHCFYPRFQPQDVCCQPPSHLLSFVCEICS